jgi:hypothetical protein
VKAIIRLHVPRIGADYDFVSVLINGHEYARFGDYYHDKGAQKAEGFVLGFALGNGIPDVTWEFTQYHDPECYDYEEDDGQE